MTPELAQLLADMRRYLVVDRSALLSDPNAERRRLIHLAEKNAALVGRIDKLTEG